MDKQKRVTEVSANDVAIVGIGLKLPGVNNVDEFWRLLARDENNLREAYRKRWNWEDFHFKDCDEQLTEDVCKTELKEGYEDTDPETFKLSENDALGMNSIQCCVLECVQMALKDGEMRFDDINGSKTGVYIGINTGNCNNTALENRALMNDITVTAPNILSSRVSNAYNLLGPSMTVDTANSPSICIINEAVKALKMGVCDMAICGGVNITTCEGINSQLLTSRNGSLAERGQVLSDILNCNFPGKDTGVIILKLFQKVKEDNDKIWGTVLTGCNHDCRTSSSFNTPPLPTQIKRLVDVYNMKGINPAQISHFEKLGAGSSQERVGTICFGKFYPKRNEQNRNTTLKNESPGTNTDPVESITGVAGIIKVLLMMTHGCIVPKFNLRENTAVSDCMVEWPALPDGSRVACLNSCASGAINYQTIIKQVEINHSLSNLAFNDKLSIVFFSAQSIEGLLRGLDHFLTKMVSDGKNDLQSIAHTSLYKRDIFMFRLAIVAESVDDLIKKVRKQLEAIHEGTFASCKQRNIVFVFGGLNNVWESSFKDLMVNNKIFRKAVRRVDSELYNHTNWSIVEKLNTETDVEKDPFIGPLVTFTRQIGFTDLYKYYGIKPNAVLGQSLGEVVAAYASGALNIEEAVQIACYRSLFLSTVVGGSMFAVRNIDVKVIMKMCEKSDGELNIALFSSPSSVTVSGSVTAVNQAMKDLQRTHKCVRDVEIAQLNVKYAHHSSYTEKPAGELKSLLTDLKGSTQTVKFLSTVSGKDAVLSEIVSPEYWEKNVRMPVLFYQALQQAIAKNSINIFVEIGHDLKLKRHLYDISSPELTRCVSPIDSTAGTKAVFETLAEMYTLGINIDI